MCTSVEYLIVIKLWALHILNQGTINRINDGSCDCAFEMYFPWKSFGETCVSVLPLKRCVIWDRKEVLRVKDNLPSHLSDLFDATCKSKLEKREHTYLSSCSDE